MKISTIAILKHSHRLLPRHVFRKKCYRTQIDFLRDQKDATGYDTYPERNSSPCVRWGGVRSDNSPQLGCGFLQAVFRPSATVSRIGLMESRLRRHCHCRCCWCGGPPPHVMDGWGARPLRWLSVLVHGVRGSPSRIGLHWNVFTKTVKTRVVFVGTKRNPCVPKFQKKKAKLPPQS